MHLLKKLGIGAGLVAASAVSIALAIPASADTGAQSADAVGVGSDTVQNAADFAFDGSPGVVGGFNTGAHNRVVSYDATGDANGRAVYDGTCGAAHANTGLGTFCDATTNQTPNLLPGSVILRAGTKPVVRPNGSGAGIKALIADVHAGYGNLPLGSIQFARASRLPTNDGTEEGACLTTDNACQGLHVYQFATDNLAIAHVTTGFDGPSTGLSAQELVGIYQCTITQWNQLPGNSGGSSATIHPLIPQSGSGTRNFFLADLSTTAGSTVNPGNCVRSVEEHDPTGIYGDPTPADAIEPFSTGKISLINSGYFANGVGYSGTLGANGAYTPNFLTTFPAGTAGDSNAVYTSTRGLYFVVRQVDVNNASAFEPGGTQNFSTALFSGGASAIRGSVGRSQIAQAGFTAAYKDCGINPTTC